MLPCFQTRFRQKACAYCCGDSGEAKLGLARTEVRDAGLGYWFWKANLMGSSRSEPTTTSLWITLLEKGSSTIIF